jgi:hypothetical protein
MQRGNINQKRERVALVWAFYSKEAVIIMFLEYKNIAEGNIKMNLRKYMV